MIYEGFSYDLNNSVLHIVFEFNLAGKYTFRPEISLPLPGKKGNDILEDSLIRNIIFNMGMLELISYWKAACPPTILIQAGQLDAVQIDWWKKLYLKGLGEFFYENGITPGDDFMDIKSRSPKTFIRHKASVGKGILIPVGGGKDSVVTLELLTETGKECHPFIINPRGASLQTAVNAGYKPDEIISMSRSIDPLLIELNKKGFLNGHTPFSAMLAFSSLLTAAIYGLNEIALSNESSANEPTIPGTNINHQYSKSLEFEEDFRDYVASYITGDISYYSYLRPLNELQITGLFSKRSHHHGSFKSCNVGSKTDTWCGKCPKCLFTYIMLSVFIGKDELISVFGTELLDDDTLLPIFKQLTGLADEKPFECVGTIDEVNIAVRYAIEACGAGELPALLKYYSEHEGTLLPVGDDLAKALKAFGPHHISGRDKIETLKKMIDAF